MKTKLLVVLLCLFVSFGAVFAYGYDSKDQYEKIRQENQLNDMQYQLDMVQLELEQQRIQDQVDRLIDDCNRDYWD